MADPHTSLIYLVAVAAGAYSVTQCGASFPFSLCDSITMLHRKASRSPNSGRPTLTQMVQRLCPESKVSRESKELEKRGSRM